MSPEIRDIAADYFEALNTPISLSCFLLLKHEEWEQLARLKALPNSYTNAKDYFLDACAVDFLRKMADLDPTKKDVDLDVVAYETYREGEARCCITNQMWNLRRLDKYSAFRDNFLYPLRKNVAALMGPCPTRLNGAFGKGSTVEHHGSRVHFLDKIATKPTYTGNAWLLLSGYSRTAWGRLHAGRHPFYGQFTAPDKGQKQLPRAYEVRAGDPIYNYEYRSSGPLQVEGNELFYVPKTALTKRTCALEPTLNSFYQKGLGATLRSSLMSHGLLLEKAQSTHRRLARRGSIDESVATLDLRNASGTIAREFVRAVTPRDWFQNLESCRSPHTLQIKPNNSYGASGNVKVERHLLEQYSSMGNGFTFELETLLFAAICMTVADIIGLKLKPGVNFSVYGDDIIVPTEMAEQVAYALEDLCNFEVNAEKSFTRGPFRESCGGDYFMGFWVRAPYLKETPNTPEKWISLHNKLYAAGIPRCLKAVLKKISEQIPTQPMNLRVYGPATYGNVCLRGSRDNWLVRKSKDCDQQLYVKVLKPLLKKEPLYMWHSLTVAVGKLYETIGKAATPRGEPIGYRTTWVSIS